MPKRIRTFIAVETPTSIRQRIEELQQSLAPHAEGVKWVDSEIVHLTIKFLGEVDERDIYDVCKRVKEVAGAWTAFECSVARAGAFPNASRPRVIWAGVAQGTTELSEIHDALDDVLGELGYPRENRAFTPHFTIGRVRRTSPNPKLRAAVDSRADWQAGSFRVTEILVMASDLSSDGPTYSVMGRARLAATESSGSDTVND
jgi:2'-5' RNA ligase